MIAAGRPRLLPALVTLGLLGGCGPDAVPPPLGSSGAGDDPDPTPPCLASDHEPGVTLLAEEGGLLEDGDEVELLRRVQGDVTLFAPLLFDGLDGGEIVSDFEVVFTADEELGARRDERFRLSCDSLARVSAPRLEVFFDRRIESGALDGVQGSLRVGLTTADGLRLVDEASIVLRHP